MPPNYLLWRQLLGVLFFLDLLCYLPYARVCLGDGYWAGHRMHTGVGMVVLILAWLAGIASIVLAIFPLVGAFLLYVLFRHLYINHRWNNLFRGGGAPGFMSHHQAMFLFLFELGSFLDATDRLVDAVLLMYRVDLAFILCCSGTYKSLSGYLRGEGMEYGMANPCWGYWFSLCRRMTPGNWLLRLQNVVAPLSQIGMGICLLIPALQSFGAILCILTFFYLSFVIRLGRLAFLMMAVPLVFLPTLDVPVAWTLDLSCHRLHSPDWLVTLLGIGPLAYIVLLPLVKLMQYFNLFLAIRFPGPVQKRLTAYANVIPIIMWRVFTPDVTNFFIRISRLDTPGGPEKPLVQEATTYSYCHWRPFFRKLRFLNVTESIVLTTVFTTLKYKQSNRQLFEEKLLAYAATLEVPAQRYYKFQYVSIQKTSNGFAHIPVVDFLVDLQQRTIVETLLVDDFSYHAPAKFSPIKETVGPGNYLPKACTPTT